MFGDRMARVQWENIEFVLTPMADRLTIIKTPTTASSLLQQSIALSIPYVDLSPMLCGKSQPQ
jgi:hypothetical protein